MMAVEKAAGTQVGNRIISGGAQAAGNALKGISGTLPTIGGALGAGLSSALGEVYNPNNKSYGKGQDNTHPDNIPDNPADINNDSAFDQNSNHWTLPTDTQPFTVPGDDPAQTRANLAAQLSKPNVIYNQDLQKSIVDKYNTAVSDRQAYLGKNMPSGAADYVNQELPKALDQVNALSDIIKKYGSATGVQNISDAVKYAEAQKDPQAAVAQGLMSDLQAVSTKSSAGRFTEFDSKFLSNMPQPGDSQAGALAKIDRAMKTAVDQYRILKPFVDYNPYDGSGAAQAAPVAPQASAPTLPPITPTSAPQSQPQATPSPYFLPMAQPLPIIQ
jgi:hypothetical protein